MSSLSTTAQSVLSFIGCTLAISVAGCTKSSKDLEPAPAFKAGYYMTGKDLSKQNIPLVSVKVNGSKVSATSWMQYTCEGISTGDLMTGSTSGGTSPTVPLGGGSTYSEGKTICEHWAELHAADGDGVDIFINNNKMETMQPTTREKFVKELRLLGNIYGLYNKTFTADDNEECLLAAELPCDKLFLEE